MTPQWNADLVRIDALSARQRAAWTAMQEGNQACASPYFTLEFAETMAASRDDTRVLALSRNGAPGGFLPLHLTRSRIARPIGAALGDHHGLITDAPDFDYRPLLAQAGIKAFLFGGGLAGQTALREAAGAPPEASWVSDLSDGYDALIADCTAADAKAMRNIRARQRKLAALDADVVIRIDDRRPAALDQLIAAKRGQYRRTGALDVFGVTWTRQVIETLFHRTTPALKGVLSTLEIDGELAAAHFGMRTPQVLHYWFPVFWPRHAGIGPGLTLYLEIARQLADDGLTAIHLGPGEYDFKKRLANAHFDVVSGQIRHPSLTGAVLAAGCKLEAVTGRLPLGRAARWPGRAIHRLDKWAALHAL